MLLARATIVEIAKILKRQHMCLMIVFVLQVTSALVAVRHHLWKAGGGEFGRHGVLHHDTLHDANICHHVYCLLPMEDE